MNTEISEYNTTRSIAKFIAAMGWIIIIAAILAVIIALGEKSGNVVILILPVAIGAAIGGLLTVASGQALRALVDTADNSRRTAEDTKQILTALNDYLVVANWLNKHLVEITPQVKEFLEQRTPTLRQ